MKTIAILLFSVVLLSACSNEEEAMDSEIVSNIINETMEEDTLRIIWKTDYQNIGQVMRDGSHIIETEEFLFLETEDLNSGPRYLEKYNKESGELLKRIEFDPIHQLHFDSKGLHVMRGPEYFLLDIDLNILEQHEFQIPALGLSSLNNDLFTCVLNANHDLSSILHKSNGSHTWKEVLRLESQDAWFRAYTCPAPHLAENGDTILYFFERKYTFENGYNESVDFHAYNISQKQFVWSKNDFDPVGDVNAKNPPIIDGDFIYCVGKVSAYCFHRESGEKLWQRDFIGPEGFQLTPYFLQNDILYVRGSTGTLRGFDKYNGTVLFEFDEGGVALDMHVDQNYVIYGDSRLCIADALTGQKRYIDEKFNVFGDLSYTPEEKRIYTGSNGQLVCWEIPN